MTFREAVEARDLEAVAALMAPGVVLNSPVTHHPYTGRETVMALLSLVIETFEDFHYVEELDAGPGRHALIFRAHVGDRRLEGIDLLRFGDDGLITELTVMIRPLSGLIPFAQSMSEKAKAAGLAPTR